MMYIKKSVIISINLITGIFLSAVNMPAMAMSSQCSSYHIQIFATSKLHKAKSMKGTLIRSGFDANITTIQSRGKTLYRLRVGTYKNKALASTSQKKLKAGYRGYPGVQSSIIVKDTSPCKNLKTQNNGGKIKFKPGSFSKTLSGSVIRGERDEYTLIAGAGHWMEVKISSVEENAVFQLSIYQYGTGKSIQLKGAKDGDDAVYWHRQLPKPGYSKDGKKNAATITVGGTRGNASYDLTVTIKNPSLLTQCYKKIEGSDVTAIQLVQNNNKVTGYYAWVPKDRDGAQGSFAGKISDNKISAHNTYLIEGSTQTEEVAFKLENNALIQGYGELIDKRKGQVFKNPNALSWTDRFTKVDCGSIKVAINSAKQAVKDIQSNSTTKTEVETKKSSENNIYKVTYNKHGALLESKKDKKIYVGKNCDASSSQYGKGTWGFANGGFNIDFKNRHIGFPRQELNIPNIGKCRF